MDKKQSYSLCLMLLIVFNAIMLILTSILSIEVFKIFNMIFVCGVFTYPFTYVISDVIQEVYGYESSRISNYVAVGSQILFSVLGYLIFLIIPKSVNTEYKMMLSRIFELNFLASIISVFCSGVSDYVNDITFEKMRRKNNISYPVSAYISSLLERLFDNTLFGIIYVFFILNYSFKEVILGNFAGFIMENIVEILLLPLSTYIVKKMKRE
ncbi:MAG: queuosine precursor transporter [Rickettsiales bacterium]|jgi:uncharacterized integral membrane protein (TIGR00697 family)|nr:queuosine precursor transporter [Rickettsiales bacterium]